MNTASARPPILPVLCLFVTTLSAQQLDWGGSVRAYPFFRVESLPEASGVTRRDTEFFSGRFTFDTRLSPEIKLETHLVLDFLSPPGSVAASVASGRASTFLPLEHEFSSSEDYSLVGSFDRLNVNLDFRSFQVRAGRQAIGWGVTYFWPAMDLFSSFAPQRIDRDYKEGVDAVRLTVPIGNFSEVQVIGAILGPSLTEDGTAAAQARFHFSGFDVGLLGGSFHSDTVVGGFLTADLRGTACRLELTWTESGDPSDARLDRGSFWRVALGLDRQLSPNVGLSLEYAFNGYGADDPGLYAILSQQDRVQRGEMTALARHYVGTAFQWQAHPLWTVSQTLLVNWNDPSAYWIPAVEWSTSNNSTVLFAAQTGIGTDLSEDLSIQSEYGSLPASLFAAFKWYF